MNCILIVLLLCSVALGQQVENRTSLEVLGTSVSDRSTILHLRNASNLSIVGITITHGALPEEDFAFLPSQKKAPGQVFDFVTSTSDQPIVLSAALFEDGTGSGNKQQIETMAARLAGAEEASRFVLRALTEEASKDSLLEMVSLREPNQMLTQGWITHAFAAGFLSVRAHAVREIKKLSSEGQALTAEGADIRTYFEDVLKVRSGRFEKTNQ